MERGRGARADTCGDDPLAAQAAAPADLGADYGALTVAELQAELEARGLPTDGLKADLVARLEADDAGP